MVIDDVEDRAGGVGVPDDSSSDYSSSSLVVAQKEKTEGIKLGGRSAPSDTRIPETRAELDGRALAITWG